ncbi:hypothetical protein MKZ38_005764 [Zalerion maritima]|uniref:NmrA-like domain-containing protein n=1 Tax=Zalerion maritima TaxID=339359 RepID=A0AAD5WQ26_9PEZI|nr:hypothetical protein MKZ38_005764 [Zalerion maritima]
MTSSNYIRNVAIVGAGGNSGSYMASSLLSTGKHTVTALTRSDSPNVPPRGCIMAQISYSEPSTIVSALGGQDCLIITMAPSPSERSSISTLIRSAAEAGVKYVIPNEWGPDTSLPAVVASVPAFQGKAPQRSLVEELGVSSWISITCGFWYEWSLTAEWRFGFSIPERRVTFFDDGETKICTSTWPQVGRAVAGLLSLPVGPEDGGDPKACVENFKNDVVYVNSFALTQKEMFASILRVTGTAASDWDVSCENSKERFEKGDADFKQRRDLKGMARAMYSRVFWEDGGADFEKARGVDNEVLGLEREDVDEATRSAIKRAEDKMMDEGPLK